jgi:hypothetical protein
MADTGIGTIVNTNIKLKSGGGVVNDATDGLSVDTGTTDGKIVQMTTGDKLPAVDGSNLTNIDTYLQGTGNAKAKTYLNFNIPFLLANGGNNTPAPLWVVTGHNTSNYALANATFKGAPNSDATNTILTNNNGLGFYGANPLAFSDGKTIIVEFSLKTNASTGEQMGWGIARTTAPFIDYDDASIEAACFTVGTDGKLYAHTSNGAGGAGHTETEITGITLTNMNTYRIQLNSTTNALFYVNGVLRQTLTTNIPTANYVNFGAGSSGNAAYPHIITQPCISISL